MLQSPSKGGGRMNVCTDLRNAECELQTDRLLGVVTRWSGLSGKRKISAPSHRWWERFGGGETAAAKHCTGTGI